MRRNFWRFRQHRGIDIHHSRIFLRGDCRSVTQNFNTADSANRFFRVGKMFSDVARSERAKNGVGDGVGKNIGIGMSFEPARMRNFDAAEN